MRKKNVLNWKIRSYLLVSTSGSRTFRFGSGSIPGLLRQFTNLGSELRSLSKLVS